MRAPNWLVADDPNPTYSDWDRRDGLSETKVVVRMNETPRLRAEPIHPPTPAEPVTPETRQGGTRGLFVAATLVLIAVGVWLTVEVSNAIQQGVFL